MASYSSRNQKLISIQFAMQQNELATENGDVNKMICDDARSPITH